MAAYKELGYKWKNEKVFECELVKSYIFPFADKLV